MRLPVLRLRRLLRAASVAYATGVVANMPGADKGGKPLLSEGETVQLNQLSVVERSLGRPYFFVEVPGFELLSPFSEKLTQAYAKELQRQRALLSVLIPDLAWSWSDTPEAILLDDQPPPADSNTLLVGRSYAVSAGVLQQSLNAVRGVPATTWARNPTADRSTISWCRAVGPDHVVFYTSTYGFDYARQATSGGVTAADRGLSHIFPLAAVYEHRRPRWPAWVEDGIDTLGARFYSEQTLQVFMLLRLSPPPTDFKMDNLFSPDLRADTEQSRRARLEAAHLFVSGAIASGGSSGMIDDDARRDAFWRFAERACREPVTEAMFLSYFGRDAWDAVMRRWAGAATNQARPPRASRAMPIIGTYWPKNNPTFPEVKVRRATRAELVRIKSEYEWLIAREFADASPDLAKQCLAIAGLRLRKTYEDGERDPRFLAVLALYEADVNPSGGQRYLEEAAATNVVRPRLYYQLAKFRETEERALAAATGGQLTVEQVRRVLQPLLIARSQRPALSEVYQTMTEVWSSGAESPPAEDLKIMAEGVQLFPRDPVLAFNVALLHAKAAAPGTAGEIIHRVLPFCDAGSEVKARLQRLLDLVGPKTAEAPLPAAASRGVEQPPAPEPAGPPVAPTTPAATTKASPAANAGPVVNLPPFKVVAEWMEIQPLLRNRVIESVRVANVRPSSPAFAAGVRDGMRIIEFQDFDVRGLSESEFAHQLNALPPSDHLKLKVLGLRESRTLVIPLSSRGYVPPPAGDPALETGPSRPPPAVATPANARNLLAEIRQALAAEMTRVRQEARATGKAQTNPVVMEEARRLAGEAAALDLPAVCDAAAEAADAVDRKSDSTAAAQMLRSVLVAAVNQKRDYAPEQRGVILKYLPKVPEFITTLDHMNWLDGADDTIAAGWKKMRGETRDDMLTLSSSSYAIVAARRGLTDALLALAKTARNPAAGQRGNGQLLRAETAALKALVGLETDDPKALSDYIMTNRNKLIFDREKALYVLKR